MNVPASMTHMFIALKTLENKNIKLYKKDLLFYLAGNIIPDLDIFLGNPYNTHNRMIGFANYLEKANYNKHFIEGLRHHIKVDAVSHSTYIIPKAKGLSRIFNIDLEISHGFIEDAINYNLFIERPSLAKTYVKINKFIQKSDIPNQLATYFDVPLQKMKRIMRDADFTFDPKTDYRNPFHAIKGLVIIFTYLRRHLRLISIKKLIYIKSVSQNITKKDYLRFLRKTIASCMN